MDIDFFKEYNDFYGHLAGDNCLHAIAGVLREQQCQGRVFCARYGGDEFMIVYTGMTAEEIRGVSETIMRGVRALYIPHEKSRCSSCITVSQGVFVKTPTGNNREWDFTRRADGLLYYAKNNGRDCVCMSTAKSRDQYTVIK